MNHLDNGRIISPEREDTAIIDKYTKIFGVQVNRKDSILNNLCRKKTISKELNMT